MNLLNLLVLALFIWGIFVVLNKFGGPSERHSDRNPQHNV